jgi:phage-related protein
VELKPLHFVGGALDDLRALPRDVRVMVGYALHEAQAGGKSEAAKPLKGFGGAGVLEVVANFDGDTYRAVYTVKFRGAVYVLHCFQKKSKRGAATPKTELDLIESRLKAAAVHHNRHYVTKGANI